MIIGEKEFRIGERCYVMGILNVTPDSFSDGGKYRSVDAALYRAEKMLAEGADLIDIGGESTRPGYLEVTAAEEICRVAPVIEAVKSRLEIPVSIDTCKAEVCEAALKAGADLVNDIWGFRRDERMAKLTAEYGAACCLMHNRETPEYEDLQGELLGDLLESAAIACRAGIAKDRIILDPGIGFGKNLDQNLEILRHLEILHRLPFPVLLGTSRKSVIGLTLELPVSERLEGTLATTVIGVIKGVSFVRVHDVKENVRAIRMTEAIYSRQSFSEEK